MLQSVLNRWLMTGAAALALFWQLMLPPVPGVADNGDFGKLLGRYGLGSGKAFVYANTKFFFGSQYRYHSGYNSSELVLIAPALEINKALSRDGSFDLRIMGAVHACLFLAAVFFFVPLVESAATGWLAILLFCDFMYAGFFNSFYVEAAALLFLLLAAVFYLRAARRRRPADSVAMLISMLLATTTSPHYAILGPWFAVLFWLGRDFLCGGRKAAAAAASLILVFTAWASYRFLGPDDYADRDAFNVIFQQVLPNSANPDRALMDLGLDASHRRWIGIHVDAPESPMRDRAFEKVFRQRTSHLKIARFYLLHPADAWNALRASLDEAGRFQSPLGNFDSGSGQPPAAQYRGLQLVSGIKRRIFYLHGGRLWLYVTGLAMLSVAVLLWKRRGLPAGAVPGVAILTGMAASTLVGSALADVSDQFRHLVEAFALFDMLLLALVWLILRSAALRRGRTRG